MATTTNFGWETPDDTDLVKDGALAMRTLGNAIDASLVDLKGGTTGQVLSKNSNTDMDFTWVTSDDANAIQNAIVDAKGDLITATAADTPARLAVGSNDSLLIADSSQSTGLKWGGLWTTYTPSVTNLTKGNGTELAKYSKIGKTVTLTYKFTLGSTSSISGQINVDLPFTANSNSNGVGIAFDAGVRTAFIGATIDGQNSTAVLVRPLRTDGTYALWDDSLSSLQTWNTNDFFQFTIVYEAV